MRRRGIVAALSGVVLCAASAAAETPAERGAYLVTSIAGCGNCHTPRDKAGYAVADMALAGGLEFPPEPLGRIVVPNITPDPDTGIGKWSEAEIVTSLREGRRPDGTIIGPPMPIRMYHRLADDDAAAIAAYLKSTKPIRNAVARSKYAVPLPPSYGPPAGHVEAPPKSDKVAYGEYLAGPVGHCMECHTPFASPGHLDMSRVGAGGREFPVFDTPGAMTVSRNITPDPNSGIGKWSDDEIKRAITTGVRPDGTKLMRTMAFDWYARISPDDLNALVAYLRSLKPVK